MVAVNISRTIIPSVSSAGTQGDGRSAEPDVSADGRYVVFWSADDLTSDDGSAVQDIYLRDTQTGTTTLVSKSFDGSTSTISGSNRPSVSDDGRYVAFMSNASNLVPNDPNSGVDAFVRDMQTGVTTLVASIDGEAADHGGINPEVSGDGRYVVFESDATDLVPGDTNGRTDVFVRNLSTGAITAVSRSTGGLQADGGSGEASITGNGRYVVFDSAAPNLVSGDTNGYGDVFMRDTVTNETTRISVGTGDVQGNGGSFDGHASDDGRYVVFSSVSSIFVPGVSDKISDLFLRDTVAGTTTLVSRYGANGDISADGRFIAYEAPNHGGGITNVFLYDRVADSTTMLSVGTDGALANGDSFNAHISADGLYVTFQSNADNLVADDTNGTKTDVFRVSLFATNADDQLIGSDKADTIDGLAGADTMIGGTGDDLYYVDVAGAAGDHVVETVGGGLDTVAARTSYTLQSGSYVDTLRTTSTANTTAIALAGNEFGQKLIGNAGGNTLNGRGGHDVLQGLGGADAFVFDRVIANANLNHIVDFSHGVDDPARP